MCKISSFAYKIEFKYTPYIIHMVCRSESNACIKNNLIQLIVILNLIVERACFKIDALSAASERYYF